MGGAAVDNGLAPLAGLQLVQRSADHARSVKGGDDREGLIRVMTPEGYLNPWIPMMILPILVGAVSAYALRDRTAIIVASAVPWLGLLAVLLWFEFVQPPTRGGASMWPIAQLIGGTIVALVGGLSAWVVSEIRSNRRSH